MAVLLSLQRLVDKYAQSLAGGSAKDILAQMVQDILDALILYENAVLALEECIGSALGSGGREVPGSQKSP